MKIIITDKTGQIIYEGIPNLYGDGITIGTSNECDIQISKMGIAKKHIQLRYDADGYLALQDIQSPFGTIVNGKKIQPGFIAIVEPGSYIELSEEVFMNIQLDDADSPYSILETEKKIFPFFMNSNEKFIRKVFNEIRVKLPRKNHSALTAAEGKITTKIRELSAVLELTYALNSITSFHRLLEFAIEMALSVTGAERGFVMLYNEEVRRLEMVTSKNFVASELHDDMLAISGLVDQCFHLDKSFVGPSHQFDLAGRRGRRIDESGILSLAAVPLKEMSTVIGVLYVDTKHSGKILTTKIEQIMKVFAAQAAVAINRARMLYNATIDTQTGIANQKLFLQRLAEEFGRAQRYQKPISIILMDIDHFSQINANHGENQGDKVLKATGKIFSDATRMHDVVARFGADSFAMLLPETSFIGAKVVAEKLKVTLSNTQIRADKRTIQITASFGVASSSKSTETPGDLLRIAEKAVKLSQKRGGNRIS